MIPLTLVLPSGAIAGSAIDEYSLDLPDAKGKVESPEQAPRTRLATLPPTVAAQLAHDPQGRSLAAIATATALGAPGGGDDLPINVAVQGDQPSALEAIGGSLGDPAVIGLILLLVLAGTALVLSRRAGRGSRDE